MPRCESEDREELIKAVYPELRAMAGRLLHRERHNHTLQKTALVHEAFLRLFGKRAVKELTPESLLAFAAHQMRQILIDHGRAHNAKKRGGEFARVPMFESEHVAGQDQFSFLDLNEALERLGELDPRALSVVELRYFCGCTIAETAAALRVSDGTVEGIWLHAKLWLRRELNRPAELAVAPQRKRSTTMISEVAAST